jgi:tetratricopeptide (TPR) repeat protein
MQGHPAQAVDRAHQAIEDAERMDHPVSLAIVLNWAASVFLWVGNLDCAEEHIDCFIAHAESHSLGPYIAVGQGHKGALAIRRGDAKGGVESLQLCLEKIHAARYELLTTELDISLVQGLAAIGRIAEGLALIDGTMGRVEANGDVSYMPELLRVKGGLLLSLQRPRDDDAEACLVKSLELSRRQAARAWELRTAVDLAARLTVQGLTESARALLQPVFEQFLEGHDTADLKVAQRLLTSLG